MTKSDHLHSEFNLSKGDVVEITLDHAANVQLMSDSDYRAYSKGRKFDYHGGYVKHSPYRITAPSTGHWHLVVDLGGGFGSVKASVQVVSPTPT